jgi:hypothetical protein
MKSCLWSEYLWAAELCFFDRVRHVTLAENSITVNAEAASVEMCLCVAGYAGPPGGTCSMCASGTYSGQGRYSRSINRLRYTLFRCSEASHI